MNIQGVSKKRNPFSKLYISNTNKAIVILQTSLYLSTFCAIIGKIFK